MPTVKDIALAIEEFAPRNLQESYDNAGLQVGHEAMEVVAAMLCLDVTEDVMAEARRMGCNMVISHHPLLFSSLRRVTGATAVERIVADAIRHNIAIYAAHTNLDSAVQGVSYEIADTIGLRDVEVLEAKEDNPETGLGVIGNLPSTPVLEFLRKVKDNFNVAALRYGGPSRLLVVKRVAICGGAGASLIRKAVGKGADAFLTGDLKYHDFTNWSQEILLADIGHYESELCTKKIFSRIIREKFPNFVTYFSETEKNPINIM